MKMIGYVDIQKHCDHVDRDKRSTVVLSKFQARLFMRMIRSGLGPLRGFAYIVDVVIYSGLLLCIFVCARNLFLLSYFYRHNDVRPDLVEFESLENGFVAVTFNPTAEPNNNNGSA